MSVFRLAFAIPVITLSMGAAIFAAQPAHATTGACSVVATGTKNTTGASNSRFVANNDGTVTGSVTVTGDCQQTVTIASWQAPDATHGLPYSAQKLYAHTTATFGAGVHTLSVKLPDCYYQVDLVRGGSATGANGGAVYDTSVMMGSLHGGSKVCTTPTPPTTPVTPTTPETPVTPAPTMPGSLPETGASFLIAVFGVGIAAIAGATQYLRRYRLTGSFSK
jgi:hypothetical protein